MRFKSLNDEDGGGKDFHGLQRWIKAHGEFEEV